MQVAPDEPAYGDSLNMLHFGEATLTFPQTLVLRYSLLEPEGRRVPAVASDYTKWFLARLRTLEPRLAQDEFLCAGRFTVADSSVGYALMLAEYRGLAPRFTASVAAYSQRLQRRDAFARALKVQDTAAWSQGISTVPALLPRP